MASNILVPQLGESVIEARVARWLKKEGEAVTPGEPVVELETEKVDLEVGAERSGVLQQITRQEGEDVLVGDVLGVIAEDGAASRTAAEQIPAPPPAPKTAGAEQAPAPAPAPPTPAPTPPAEAAGPPVESRARATPTARKLAAEHAVDVGRVAGTGAAGRVTKQDVVAYLDRRPPPEAPPAAPGALPAAVEGRPEERVRMSKRRLTIARNLVEAQQTAAMLTTFNEVDMRAVMALRTRWKERFKAQYGVGLGLSSFFITASVAALKAFPRLNAELQGEEMVLKRYYDIGIAVGAPQGLVVPVIRDADRLGFADIERAVRDFAARAEEGTLSLADLRGGTFTITNGGVFGSMLSTPILNPPQVGILGLHKIVDRPVVVEGQVVVRPVMYVALTYDHRIVDGREAVQFLVRVKELVEDPGHLLLER